jgi:hypothetical protein
VTEGGLGAVSLDEFPSHENSKCNFETRCKSPTTTAWEDVAIVHGTIRQTPNERGVGQDNCGNEERGSHGEAGFLERDGHAKHASETVCRVLVLAADRKLQLPGVWSG